MICADVLDGVATLRDDSVQMVCTSPPYWGLRNYHMAGQIGLEKTPEEYVTKLVAVFREVRRVLRKDGTLWLNLGDSYAGSAQGWGHDKQYAGPKQSTNRGSLNQPLTEAKIGFQRPPGYISSRQPNGLKPKDLVGIPWRVAFALQADGWWLRSDIIWSKPNPMPESVEDRPTRAHEYLFLLTKSARYYYDAEAIKEPSTCDRERGTATYQQVPGGGDNAGLSRKKVRSPAGWRTDKGGHGSIHPEGREPDVTYNEIEAASRNRRSVWTIATQPFSGAHFATFPEKLVELCILAGSQPSDVVLDPFCGSGTVLAVAQRFGRQAIGIELHADYCQLARERIRDQTIGLPL